MHSAKDYSLPDFALTPGNQLLSVIPYSERSQLQTDFELKHIPCRTILYEAGEEIRTCSFPVGGLASVLTVMEDGSSVESACVGREGMLGVPALMRRTVSPHRCAMQIAGEAWQISANRLLQAFQESSILQLTLVRYIDFRLFEAGQIVGCNLLHTVKQRLATWLLRARVRVQSDELPLTHEFLSQILGAQRSTVTLAARELEVADIIRYKRGFIKILDCQKLKRTACECYSVLEREISAIIEPEDNRFIA